MSLDVVDGGFRGNTGKLELKRGAFNLFTSCCRSKFGHIVNDYCMVLLVRTHFIKTFYHINYLFYTKLLARINKKKRINI